MRKKDEAEITIHENDWNSYIEIRDVLRVPYGKTILFQKTNLMLSEFFAEWNDLRMKLSQYDIKLSNDVQADMKKREKELLEYPTILASVYLHPEYYFLLENSQKSCAIAHISELYRKLYSKDRGFITEGGNFSAEEPASEDMPNNVRDLIKMKKRALAHNNPPDDVSAIAHAIERYEHYLKSKLNNVNDLDEFWIKYAKNEPKLWEVAKIILAAAST